MKEKYELRFRPDGKFKILVVGDIHEKYRIDEKSEDFLRFINRKNLVVIGKRRIFAPCLETI